MDLFTYLMAKNGQNTGRDLFSYLLGKNAGGSGTYTTFSGTSLNILNTLKSKIKNIELKPSEITQDGTPTPDAPIEVNTVTGNNTITIEGKNLFDYNNTTVGALFGNPAVKESNGYKGGWLYEVVLQKPIQPGTYTISFKVKDADNSTTANMRLVDENNQGIEGSIINCNSTNSSTITTTKTISKLRIDNGLNTVTTLIYDIQIEANSTMTEYNVYQSQNYSINLGSIEYAKIGSVEDKIYRDDNGDWYFEEHVKKLILNGTETITNQFGASLFGTSLVSLKDIATAISYSDYYKFNPIQTGLNAGLSHGEFATQYGQTLYIKDTRYTTVDGFKNWLTTHPVKFYYDLREAITTQITDSTLITQLEALYQNAQSYGGATNVTQTNAKLPFVLNMDVLIKGE